MDAGNGGITSVHAVAEIEEPCGVVSSKQSFVSSSLSDPESTGVKQPSEALASQSVDGFNLLELGGGNVSSSPFFILFQK